MGHIAVNMSVTGFESLSVSYWFVRIYSFKSVHQTYFTLLMRLKWNLIKLWHDEFTVMYSKYLRKNYSGSSIGRAPNLQAGVVVLITSMCKWLLGCLQMAISMGPTQVCHGLALEDVTVFLRNSRTIFNRVWTTLSSIWCVETNLRQKCEAG